MKKPHSVKLLASVLLSCGISAGCAGPQMKDSAARSGPPGASEAREAIKTASDAISTANDNRWIWLHTEKLLKQAQAAAAKGDNADAVRLANMAAFQAEAAIKQYNYEKAHPRGFLYQ